MRESDAPVGQRAAPWLIWGPQVYGDVPRTGEVANAHCVHLPRPPPGPGPLRARSFPPAGRPTP